MQKIELSNMIYMPVCRSWCERRVVSSAHLLVFSDPLDSQEPATIIDSILLADVQDVRALIGEGDQEPSQNSHPQLKKFAHQAIPPCNGMENVKDGRTRSWVDSLPRVGGVNRFSNTVEIRSSHLIIEEVDGPPIPFTLQTSASLHFEEWILLTSATVE
jgi:hypothetical protein